MADKVIVVLSGGLDSTTALWDALHQGLQVEAVSFNYGQRHRKELEYAARVADYWDIRHDIVDLSGLTPLLAESGSSLVSIRTDVPEGHYAEDNMKATVVPNRNMIMLSIAGGVAVARGAKAIVTGVHSGDHFIYPDCRPEFLQAVGNALAVGNEGFARWMHHPNPDIAFVSPILAPYLMSTKEDIAFRAMEIGMPLNMTWSCYKGGEVHCGKCGTCVERLEAIHGAKQRFLHTTNFEYEDNTPYADENYWKEVVKNV